MSEESVESAKRCPQCGSTQAIASFLDGICEICWDANETTDLRFTAKRNKHKHSHSHDKDFE